MESMELEVKIRLKIDISNWKESFFGARSDGDLIRGKP